MSTVAQESAGTPHPNSSGVLIGLHHINSNNNTATFNTSIPSHSKRSLKRARPNKEGTNDDVVRAMVGPQLTSASEDTSHDSPPSKTRDRGTGITVPKSLDDWIVVGVFLASRSFPKLLFFLPLIEQGSSKRLDLVVPFKHMMASLSLKCNDNDQGESLLHVRVVQKVDRSSKRPTGEVRYLCTDMAVSYHMGNNAFKWILFHPTMFQVCCTTWMSSLNRAELEKHLTLANAKGSMLFQTPEAEPARVFLHAILNGKALPAMCTFRQPPSSYVRSDHCATTDATSAFVSAPTTTTDDIKIAAAAAAAAASLGVDRATVDFQALPMSHRTLQTAPDAVELLSSALSRIDPLSFQQSEQNDGEPVVAAASVASNLDITPLRSTSNELSLDHRLKKAYERAPIKRDLLTFVQFSSVTIEATDHTQAIPSVVICNHSQVETQEQTTFDLLSAHRNNTGDMIATTKDSSLLRRKKQRVSDESANMQHKLPLPQLQPIVSSEDSVTLSQLMMDPLLLLGTVALADEIYGNSESNAGAEINNNVSVHQSAAAAASVCSTTSTMAHEPNLTFSPVNKEIELKRTEQLEIQTLTTPITATSTSSVTSCPYSYRPYTSYPDHLHSVTLNGWYLPITYGYSLMGCVPTVPWFMRSHH